MNRLRTTTFDYLDRMSGKYGLFEHAKGTVRREEHGYCVDDNARLLVVASRESGNEVADRLGRLALSFVTEAQDTQGNVRNRMNSDGRWTDKATTEDSWGRSIWALGVAATQNSDSDIRKAAQSGFDRGVAQRSRWSRSMAFAALGAAEVVTEYPEHAAARALLTDTLDAVGEIQPGTWTWPEARLRYANGALAEAVIAAGAALASKHDLQRGLEMLAWLLETETPEGHLSVTGTKGRGPEDRGPQFDQQPIEVAAIADACWRAYAITGDDIWAGGVSAAANWFTGSNDVGLQMYDADSGGGFDGLQPKQVNLNQGAESTLALVTTMQRASSFVFAP
ncbi:MAG TPA: hypothetical protein VMV52_02405 [Candidatus Nanopelagicaceae bacterium]|nr:hypothetical protein [Candidatus Nanopelagicaceae bacterium]